MAEVWLATDLLLDRRVAVKWLKPTLATDEVVAERFRREAKAAASLDHANIVAVYDVFEDENRQAVVMQLVDGKSLRQLLDTQKRLSPELTCHIGSAVAAALDHAHHAGFVHRDVKPGNIMITPDGRVLLTDFGIAKGLHGDSGDDLTSDNIMMGTAKYLSPEQVRGKKLDGRADLYSLGLVLYECLAGRVPFLGESDADTALARLQRDPTDLARLRATLPTRLVNVIHDLLARNPDQRPESGAALIAELKAAASEGAPPVDPTDGERSPVAPFNAGRLMRAPSDLRGRASDRTRGTRATPPRGKTKREAPSRPTPRPGDRARGRETGRDALTGRAAPHPSMRPQHSGAPIDPMLSGPVAIPGEPPHITGRVPVTPRAEPTTRVATSPSVPSVAPDRTPPAGTPLRGAPAKGLEQRWGPSLALVGGLVGVALVLIVLLWAVIEYGGEDGATPTTTIVVDAAAPVTPDADPGAVDATGDGQSGDGAAVEPVAAETATISGIVTFDPVGRPGVVGGNGEENDDLVDQAIDGDTSTSWRTSCYSNEYMGGKPGVGLTTTFDAPTDRPIQVDVPSGPYIVDVFGSDAESAPTDTDGWGQAIDRSFGDEPATFTVTPGAPIRHLLVLVVRLAPDDVCSADNPFAGRIAEIALT